MSGTNGCGTAEAWPAAVATNGVRVAGMLPVLADVASTARGYGDRAVCVVDDSPVPSAWRVAFGAAAELMSASTGVTMSIGGPRDLTATGPRIGCVSVEPAGDDGVLGALRHVAPERLLPRVLVVLRAEDVRSGSGAGVVELVRAFNEEGGPRTLHGTPRSHLSGGRSSAARCFVLRVGDHPGMGVIPLEGSTGRPLRFGTGRT